MSTDGPDLRPALARSIDEARAARGSWLQTRSGNRFDFAEPDPEAIDISDIAWSLAHMPRFLGHTEAPISVAQHSVWVSEWVPDEDALSGLLHDAHEAFTGDLPSPAKRFIRANYGDAWDRFEDHVARAIRAAFGLPDVMPESVKKADLVALATEKRDLFGTHRGDWPPLPMPSVGVIHSQAPREAYFAFLGRYHELREERGI